MTPRIAYQNPTIGEYNDLRKSVNWPTFAPSLVARALANSLFSVVAHDNGQISGMGRIVGDGAVYSHIQDVIVRPEYQRKGSLIKKKLLIFAERSGGKHTNIGLLCGQGREEFYKDFGFIERPSFF